MHSLVIFLHGVGSRGGDLASLGEFWADALPGAAFAAPDAPFAFDQGGSGHQWFSVSGVTSANRPQRIVEARAVFDETLTRIIAEHGFADKLDRVALVGFSQGAIMSLDALVSGRWPIAAVVAFSGRLASPEPFTPTLATQALLVHGSIDTVIPASESEGANARLVGIGVNSTCHILRGVGHTISSEGAVMAATFLRSVLKLG
ncbi:phospholipase/carboxylesterase [Ochrobactrum sp. 19YEA23]|nr:phospholipase/carboxylesterase [Ochrobactrum sp. 19YEA23]